jgi:pentatricopeptide repeat protein
VINGEQAGSVLSGIFFHFVFTLLPLLQMVRSPSRRKNDFFMRYVLPIMLVVVLLNSCSRRSAPISILKPATLTLPGDVDYMVTIDRSKPSGTFWNIAEGILTGEAIGQDREGRRMAIDALRRGLTRTPRFTVVHSGVELEGSRSGASFPVPLPWHEVEAYCRQYDADVLVALELFDSDTPISVRREKRKDKEGKEYFEYRVDQQVNIRTGWRVYDPLKRVILDEYITTAHRTFSNSGRDSLQAVRARRWQREDVRQIAVLAGEAYARRIAPLWTVESRSYYRKGGKINQGLYQRANAFAKLGKWEEAKAIYQQIHDQSAEPKMAARAAFNLAVAHEQLGDLDEALRWCERAYVQYRLRRAKSYYQLLTQRVYDEELLDRQL